MRNSISKLSGYLSLSRKIIFLSFVWFACWFRIPEKAGFWSATISVVLAIFRVVERKLQEVKNECKVTLFTRGENYARGTMGSGVLSFDREDEEIGSP